MQMNIQAPDGRSKRTTACSPSHSRRSSSNTKLRLRVEDCPARRRTRDVMDEAQDATRRPRLANERTYLAWCRPGLTTFAVSVGAGKLVPAVTSGAAWPFELVGVAFAAVG